MKLEHRLSKLFFKFIHKTPLQDRGVTAQDLARELDRQGFIELVSEDRFIELPKLFDPKYKKDFWITVNGAKPIKFTQKGADIMQKSIKKASKTVIFLILALSLTNCASKPKGFELPIALSETFRNGALKGLEAADSADLGMPNQNDRVSHVCTSQPIYSLEGYYIRTAVTCF
jgi:hypothetical protein